MKGRLHYKEIKLNTTLKNIEFVNANWIIILMFRFEWIFYHIERQMLVDFTSKKIIRLPIFILFRRMGEWR